MEQETINTFGRYIDNLTVGEYKTIRAAIIAKCMITRQIFNHWKTGVTKVPKLARPIIEDIAKQEIFTSNYDAK